MWANKVGPEVVLAINAIGVAGQYFRRSLYHWLTRPPFVTLTLSFPSSAGWLSSGQSSSAGLLRHRPLRVRKHPQGLRLQAAFQVPRLLFPNWERIFLWEVRGLNRHNHSWFIHINLWSETHWRRVCVSPSAGGWRWSAAPRFHLVRLVCWTAKSPILSELICQHLLLLLISTNSISGTFVHVCAHILVLFFFYCCNGDTSAGLDCIRDCISWHFYSQHFKNSLFTEVILYSFLTVSATSYLFLFYFMLPLVVFTMRKSWLTVTVNVNNFSQTG